MNAKVLIAETLDLPLTDKWRVTVVGVPPLTLRNNYPPEQTWLPFVQALVLARRQEPEPKHNPVPKANRINYSAKMKPGQLGDHLTKQWNAGRIHLQGETLWLFSHREGVDQPVLPFPGFKKISKNEMKRIVRAGYPGFDRVDASGKPPMISFDPIHRDDVAKWCAEHCNCRYHVAQKVAYFERIREAVIAKLAVPT
jgi:hypothetical protein